MSDSGRYKFEKSCALVLVGLGDEDWWGRYLVDKDETKRLREQVEEVSRKKRGMFANRANDFVTLMELKDFADDADHRERILKHSSALHGLLRDDFVENVFDEFDKNHDNGLDPEEWEQFVAKLARKNLEYLLATGFQAFRAFYGRNQTWDLHPEDFSWDVIQQDLLGAAGSLGRDSGCEEALPAASSAEELLADEPLVVTKLPPKLPPKSFQVGFDPDCDGWNPFPQGWWHDLHYYSANNHPLHGIFMCDPHLPLTWIERVWMEVATIGFTTGISIMHKRWVEGTHCPPQLQFLQNEFVFSLVMVTIPGMIMWWTLFLLFTCKCGHVNKAKSTPAEARHAKKKTVVGAAIAYILCTLGLIYLLGFFVYFQYQITDVKPYYLLVFVSRIKSYIIFWCLVVFVYFNPLIAWGTPDPDKPQTGLGDLIGLGQWRIEKQRFQVRCVSVANKRNSLRHEAPGLV